MARIQMRRKNTTGAPNVGDLLVGEICLVMADNSIYWKKDASTLVGPIIVAAGGVGDMLKSTYDSNNDGKVDSADNADKLGGTVAASYALQGWVTTQITNAINSLVNGAPGALDTLIELSNALGGDANFAATIATSLSNKLDQSSILDGGVI